MKTLYLVAGEISGDTHGAALMKSLAKMGEWSFSGLGGPRMVLESGQIENWLDDAAVLGLWEVMKKYSYFSHKMADTVSDIERANPNGVVLIDYPGFNLRLAKRLRAGGYQGKLIYYISPQVWAWKKGRIRQMAELLDLMICIFPFEKELYESSGLPTVFSGHPLIDTLTLEQDAVIEREENLVALLPGSREREVSALFPPMLEAARLLLVEMPHLRFATSAATPSLCETLQNMVAEAGLTEKFRIGHGTSRNIMRAAKTGVVASGTATLEAACLGLPYCLAYKVAWLTAFAARRVIKVKFLGIVNVIAGREVVKELLQENATGRNIAAELSRLLKDNTARQTLKEDLSEIVSSLGEGGAHENAAMAVTGALQ